MVAARLDLFGDEAFYWQCGQRPAIAYADHPPVTAMLTRFGTELAGDTPLGARLVFLLLGVAFPWVVYMLSRPLVGRRDSWLAAAACLALPAFAHLGLLAIPDAAMLPATAIFLLGFERATRTGSAGAWILAGVAGAFGLATHYRFVLVPAAAIIYLLAGHQGRRHWRRPGPWLMLALLAVGLAPSIVYNLRRDFAPVRYYLAGRHGTSFDTGALFEHLAAQALLITPLLYAALIAVLVSLCRGASAGDDRARLAATFSLAYLGFFLLASPFEDSGLMVAHWPLPGYLPLLPYLPATLRRFSGKRSSGGMLRRVIAFSAPALGALAITLVLIELGSGLLHLGAVREPFIGWSQAAARARSMAFHRREVEQAPDLRPAAAGKRVIVADNYKLGANLEFALHAEADVYVLDHHKNHQHGRARQLATWGIDEPGLRRRAGERVGVSGGSPPALLVIEVSQIRTGEHDAWLAHAGSFFEHLEAAGELRIPSTGKRKKFKIYRFYHGRLTTRGMT